MRRVRRKYNKKNINKKIYRKFTKRKRRRSFNVDVKHYILVEIILLSLLCSIFVFPFCFERLISSVKDLLNSFVYYFTTLFFNKSDFVNPTVVEIPIDFGETIFPFDFETFKEGMKRFFPLFFSRDMISKFSLKVYDDIYYFLLFLTILLPFLLIVAFTIDDSFFEETLIYKDSKFLKRFKKFRKRILLTVYDSINSLLVFYKEHKAYKVILFFIWFYNLNFFTIVIEFFSAYFYYFSSFDFSSIYTQFVKLMLDLSVFILYVPKIVKFYLFFKVLFWWRDLVARDVLEHRESMNKGYVNSLPVAVLFTNPMGGGKDLTQTSMVLSNQVLFRAKALELLMNNYIRYPNFPFYEFERQLVLALNSGRVRSLASCSSFVEGKKNKFLKNPCSKNLFGYDFKTYNTSYDNGLIITDIFDMLVNYAKEYLIYVTECLIIANLSIRTDNEKHCSEGLLPIFDTGFFGKPSIFKNGENKFCHILDLDALRMGVKVIADNDLAYAFEFGVIAISEVGKERGNQITNKRFDAKDKKSNPLNDKFALKLKMIRHGATVENYCFVRIFMNEQRQSSLSADIAELATVNVIDEVTDFEIVKPLFFVEQLLYDLFFPKFYDFIIRYRSCRADNNLFVHLLKFVFSKFFNYMEKQHNLYDSAICYLNVRKGDQEEFKDRHKFYRQKQKDFKMQYSTDCFAGYTEEAVVESGKGLDDFPAYKNILASTEELKLQHSFWITELLDILEEKTDSKWELNNGRL